VAQGVRNEKDVAPKLGAPTFTLSGIHSNGRDFTPGAAKSGNLMIMASLFILIFGGMLWYLIHGFMRK